MFNRKDQIIKEYNKIIENRLPNILNLMNHDKRVIGFTKNKDHLEYDDTELLSKMFSKE